MAFPRPSQSPWAEPGSGVFGVLRFPFRRIIDAKDSRPHCVESPMKPAIFWILLPCASAIASTSLAADETPHYVRLASGVSGHVHPAACVTKKGTVLVIFGQQEYIDLRIA